jgi:hypothetical protein
MKTTTNQEEENEIFEMSNQGIFLLLLCPRFQIVDADLV